MATPKNADAKSKKPSVKKTTLVDPNESKDSKFKRIVVKRTRKVVAILNNIGNCSNTSVYSYNQEQVDAIFLTIKKAYDSAKEKFEKKAEIKKASEFDLV